jgi:hypothetical protein
MHTHKNAAAPDSGAVYTFALNGVPLYEARIHAVNGCWATVEVLRPLDGPHSGQYKPGQRFDIKVASYSITE